MVDHHRVDARTRRGGGQRHLGDGRVGATQRESPYGFAHWLKLTVQFPRIVIERTGIREVEELGQFAAAMLRRVR